MEGLGRGGNQEVTGGHAALVGCWLPAGVPKSSSSSNFLSSFSSSSLCCDWLARDSRKWKRLQSGGSKPQFFFLVVLSASKQKVTAIGSLTPPTSQPGQTRLFPHVQVLAAAQGCSAKLRPLLPCSAMTSPGAGGRVHLSRCRQSAASAGVLLGF